MARKKTAQILYNSTISAGILNLILKENAEVGESVNSIVKKYKLDVNISNRFEFIYKDGLLIGVDLTKYQKSTSLKYEDISAEHVQLLEDTVAEIWESNNKDFTKISVSAVKKELIRKLEGKGEIKSMKKVMSIDLGNNNVKVAVNGKAFSFTNKISREDRKEALGDNEWIKMNDDYNYYIISNIDSKYEKSASKKDKNFIPTLNYAIVKALVEAGEDISEEVELDIALLTPINQSSEKEEYIAKIKECDDNIVECKVNGIEYMIKIKINNVIAMLEGCSSFFLLDNIKGINTLIDIGSKTINVCKAVNGKFQSVETIDDLGSFHYYQALVNKINDRDITIDNIQDMIEVNIVEHDKELLASYIKNVLEESNKMVKFKTNNRVIFTGGTVKLLTDNGIRFAKGNLEVMENPIFSNTLGALKVMESKFGGK